MITIAIDVRKSIHDNMTTTMIIIIGRGVTLVNNRRPMIGLIDC